MAVVPILGEIHPGVLVSLSRLGMDELGVAQAIRDGELVSPQWYENVALFALRITGTGVAYRTKLDEYVYRKPDLYLNQHFLDRCNGLPVIWEHPDTGKLNTEEFLDRVIGTIVLPYIKGEEVWGIAKIYDQDAARAMESKQLSTSPAVVFRATDGNQRATLEDGSALLVEGKPSLLDHLAICEEGVWDKGRDPTGVELPTTTPEGSDMPEMEKEMPEKRDDAEHSGGNLDRLLKGVDAICGRLDAMEKRMDSMSHHRKDDDNDDDDKAHRKDAKGRRHDDDDDDDDKAHRKDAKGRRHDDDDDDDEHAEMGEPKELAADKKKARKDDDDDDKAHRKDSKRHRKDDDESFKKWAEEEGKELAHKSDDDDNDDDKGKRHRKDDDGVAGKAASELANWRHHRRLDDDDDDRSRKDSTRSMDKHIAAEIRRLSESVARMPKSMSDADYAAMADCQARADSVYGAFGERAPAPLQGEGLGAYRVRLAKGIQKHSNAWKTVSLRDLPGNALDIAEAQIYADAQAAAKNPTDVPLGQLREIRRRDAADRVITEFVGEPNSWMGAFRTPARAISKPFFRPRAGG